MALIKCPECGRENVSHKAEACPSCGFGVKAHYEKMMADRENVQRKKQEQEWMEQRRKRAEIEEERRQKQRLSDIKMPEEPRISKSGMISGLLICLFGAVVLVNTIIDHSRSHSINSGNGDPVILALGSIVLGVIIIFCTLRNYMKTIERYDLAQSDFAKYQQMIIKEQDAEQRRMEAEYRAQQTKIDAMPKCPLCSSSNVERISTTSRVVSVAAVGIASGKIGKQYKCKNCKHMW